MTALIGQTLGPYLILEQVGQGGMATVFKAYNEEESRYVAVKVLSPTMAQDPQFLRRFRREAEVLQHLDHPHIVPVEDFGQENGYAYLVMPYLRVGSLIDRVEEGPLNPQEGGRLMDQIASGLHYAHQQGVVHRDIKPSNVLLDSEGNALLSDFGLVQVVDASLSLTGSALIGTPAYISPEQALGDEVDARSDQYSLGILLFELTTGFKPFGGATPMATVMKHVHEPLPSPRVISPSVPESVERVILKATAKDPAERFSSVAEMNAAFQAALAHTLDPTLHPAPSIEVPKTAIHPASVSVLPPADGPSRRRRNLLLAALLALLLLLVPLLSGLLPSATSAGSPGNQTLAALGDDQLTAFSGTIQALSTEVVDEGTVTLSADEIQTVVVQTVMATGFAPGGDATATPTWTDTPAGGGGEGTPSPTPESSSTAGVPTLTPALSPTAPGETPAPTAISSATAPVPPSPTRTATGTSPPSGTPPPTQTSPPPASPTATRTPTVSPSPWPSSTWTPTASPPPPTQTPPPPTPTPTEDDGTSGICAPLSLISLLPSGSDMSWRVINGGTATVTITGIFLDWPPPNDALERIRYGGQTIWTGSDQSPPTQITGGWSGGDRTLGPGGNKELVFTFDEDAALMGYWLEITFDGQCTL